MFVDWGFDADEVSRQHAAERRRRESNLQESRRQAADDRARERTLEAQKRETEFEYFEACAREIVEAGGAQAGAREIREVADALRFIHDSQLGARWFVQEYADEHSRAWSENRQVSERVGFFRTCFFQPVLIENLKGSWGSLMEDFARGKENAREKGKPFNSAYYVYKRALYGIFAFLEVPRQHSAGGESNLWKETHDELRGFERGKPKPILSIYPLSEKLILEAARERNRRINPAMTRISGPHRELHYVDDLSGKPVKTAETPVPAAKQKLF